MEKKQNVPALRFQGFSGEWNTHALESMCDVFTDGDWIEANDQSNSGIRLIQTGNIGVTEYIDKPKHKKWISKETFDRLHCTAVLPGDLLISRLPEPAGRACIIPDLEMEMITAVDCTIARVAEEYSKKYLVQYLSTNKYFSEVRDCLAGGTRQRISRGNLSVFIIPVPVEKTEQDKIGDFFERLDNRIIAKREKFRKLQQFRQAMLTKLFPREGAAEPELRFRGFSGKWEYKSLGSLANITSGFLGDATLTAGKYRLTRIETIANNEVDERKIGYSNKDPGNMYLLAKGDILYSNINSYEHIGKVARYHGKSVLYHGINLLRLSPYKQVEPSFLEYLLKTESRKKWAKSHANRAVNQASINASLLASQKVPVCEMDEQKAIGAFFDNLQIYISLQQKKLEQMQRLKAALLEKLFV